MTQVKGCVGLMSVCLYIITGDYMMYMYMIIYVCVYDHRCQGDEPCLHGIFLTFCIVPPVVAVVGFQGEG